MDNKTKDLNDKLVENLRDIKKIEKGTQNLRTDFQNELKDILIDLREIQNDLEEFKNNKNEKRD